MASYWTKPRGGAGWLAMAGMGAGLVWWPIAVVAGGGWAALAVRGLRRSARAMAHLEIALPEARRTGPLAPCDRIVGSIDDLPFEIRNGLDTMHVLVGTPLPHGIHIERPVAGWGIGDPAFDARFSVHADDSDSELGWRAMLTAELRARLIDVFGGRPVMLRDGWFDLVIDDDDADGAAIERMVREGVALGRALYERIAADRPLEAFVDQIPREPLADVRRTHYTWLVDGGYEVPALLHLASRDPDPEIRAWANAQRPSETLYR